MRTALAAAFALLASAHPALAQSPKPRPEIGIRGGIMRVTEKNDFGSQSYTVMALPAGPPFAPGGVHLTLFMSPRFAIEPELGIVRISDEGSSFMLTTAALQFNGFLGADANKSPYLFAQVATIREDEDGGGDSDNAFGVGAGYRKVYRESIALRYELRYRRWSRPFGSANEFGLLIGFGAVIR